MDYSVKPIIEWPGKLTPAGKRKRGDFSTTYASTLSHLDREIHHLKGANVVIQLALEFEDIRQDGRPYANARPRHPGVIVTFQSEHGPLSYWTDQYDDWHSNVRAISLALAGLRAVGRHGVNKQGSQYAGYKQLPPATGNGTGILTEEDAGKFIADHSDVQAQFIFADKGVFDLAYNKAQRKLHPDAGGTNEQFVALQEAAALLRKRHGL